MSLCSSVYLHMCQTQSQWHSREVLWPYRAYFELHSSDWWLVLQLLAQRQYKRLWFWHIANVGNNHVARFCARTHAHAQMHTHIHTHTAQFDNRLDESVICIRPTQNRNFIRTRTHTHTHAHLSAHAYANARTLSNTYMHTLIYANSKWPSL